MNQNYHLLAKVSSAIAKKLRSSAMPPESYGVTGSSWRCSLISVKPLSYLLLMFLLVFNVHESYAQAGSYSFTQSTEAYTPVVGTNSTAVGDDGTQAAIDIGFTFNFEGTDYTTFGITTNGMIKMGSTSISSGFTNTLSNTSTNRPLIAPFWDDNNRNSGSIAYTVTGSAPNRVLHVGWDQIKIGGSGSTSGTNTASFKLRLYETTNVIEFVYGSMASAGTLTASIGINGQNTFLSVTPGNPATASSVTANNSINSVANLAGNLYRFTPPMPCTGTPTAGILAISSQNICTGSTPAAITAIGYTTGASGITFQWEQSANGVDWVNAVGGSNATTASYTPPSFAGTTIYYRMKVTCASTGLTATTNAATIALPVAPATQVTNLTTTALNLTSVGLSWTSGNGNRRVVVISPTTITDLENSTGPALTASAAYSGSGQQIVYDGTGTTVTITGLTANTSYNIKVYEYTRCGSSSPYSYYYNTTSGSNLLSINTCSPITSLPWVEGFEGVTTGTSVVGLSTNLPSCWNSQSTRWQSSSATTNTSPRTGTKYIRYQWSSTNIFMWTPGFQLEAGKSYDFSFYAQGDGGSGWTNDVFVNTSQSSTGATQLGATYVAPTNTTYAHVLRTFVPTVSGVYYFAIRGNQASSSPNYMAFDDFELAESPETGVAPPCAHTPWPANAATAIQRNPTLTWGGTVQVTDSYDVYLGTSSNPPFVANVTAQSYKPATLLANTTYYWKVVAKNEFGDATGCTTWSFTTGANIDYCVPVISSGCTGGDVIARVILNTLDNNSGTGCPVTSGYSDYTTSTNPAHTTSLQAGSSYSCTVYAGQYGQGYAAWIDYNDDGVFEESERIGYSNGIVSGSGTAGELGSSASFPIALPCNPPVGTHRLRVRAMYNTQGINVTPCANNSFGEVEDYLITITEPAACPQPSMLAATSITASAATLSWTIGCTETAWEVLVQDAGGETPTAGSTGAEATSTTYSAEGLVAGHNYEFYVRANCGDEDGNSVWSGPIAFKTLPSAAPDCATLVAPADGTIGLPLGANQSYVFSWTPNGQAADTYEFYAGFAADELEYIDETDETSMTITGIPAGETIYWQVVPVNVVGSATDCAVYSFTTTAIAGDACSTAISLDALTSPYTGSTVNFTDNLRASCSSSSAAGKDGFYSITVPANYTLSIGISGSNYDSVHTLAYGDCNGMTQIMCSDSETSTETWANYTGSDQTVYWIQDAWSTGSGSFTLTWSLTPPPPCIPPSALTVNVTNTTAVASWIASDSDPDNGYQYEVRSSGAAGSGSTGLVSSGTVTGLESNPITGLNIGATYTVYIRSLCADENSTWASKAFTVPVPNDLCANALPISCGQSIVGSTVNATNDNMAVCGISGVTTQNTPGVWFKFTGDGSDVTITTCGGTGDTRLAVYSGTCGAFTCITGNDDNSACTTNTLSSEVLFSTVAGTQYYILVYNYSTSNAFQISMSCVVPCTPATTNDECATATALTVGMPLLSNNTCSTPSTGVAYPSCGSSFATYYDAWYSFNSGSHTTLQVALNNAPASTGFILYTGTCGSLAPVTNSCVTTGIATNLTLTANTNYYVRVYTIGAANRGNYTLSVKVPCARPTGVTASAVAVNTATVSWTAPASGAPAGGYEYEVRTSGAAGSGSEGLAASGTTANTTVGLTGLAAETAHSVYVRATCAEGDYSPWTTVVSFTTLPSCARPTGVAASNVAINSATISWTAPSPAPVNGYVWEVRTSGAAGSGTTGLFGTSTTANTSVNLTLLAPATTYSVYVRSSCADGDLSSWTSVVTFRTKVPNDVCSGAITVTCGSTVTGSLADATNENMAVCGISGVTTQNTPGVWYKYVSDGSDVTFSTCSTTYVSDTRMAVFTGSCGTLTCVGGNDDNSACTGATLTSSVTVSNTTPGTTYYVLVYAYSSTTLSFELTTSCAPACAPAAGNNESQYAQTVAVGSVTATHNTCATASLGVAYPSCGSSFATYYDTWYKFNSGANTSVIVSTTATAPTVVGFAVYSGAYNALTQVGSCSTTGVATTISGLTPHTVYYIRAYSSSTAARGNFNLSLTVPCTAPTGVTAVATSVSAATISWTAATSAPANGYQYEVRTSGTAGSGSAGLVTSGNASALNAAVSGLSANTTYSVYVRSVCGENTYSSWSSAATFTVGYCTPAPTSASGNGIINVSFDTVNNTTAGEPGNYADYTAMAGAGVRGTAITVNVTHANAQYTRIWVDWNNDMDFNDAGETVYTSSSATTTAAATFTIPATATLGNLRMRIAGAATSTVTACYTGANASFEDYTLTVSSEGVAQLKPESCNATVTSFNAGIFAHNVIGATAYRFRVSSQLGTQVLERQENSWFRLNMLNNYAYGVTYLVEVSVMIDGVWSDYGPACKVFAQGTVPTTSLKDCNVVIDNFGTNIFANSVQNATTYRFKVVVGANTYIIDRPNVGFKLNMLPVYTYGTTYTISVNVLSGGMWSGYGPECTVTTINKLPSTSLRAADCGITVSNLSQGIYATTVPGAEMYHFKVVSSSGTQVIDTPNSYIKLNMIAGYDYNETYTISVTVSASGVLSSDEGASCTVSSPATLPLTNLRAADCGATVANRNAAIYATVVQGAQIYRFRIVAASGTYTIDRVNSAYFKFNMLAPGAVVSGETVVVTVMTISANGTESAYGSPCNVTLSSLSGRPGADNEAEPKISAKSYPNPFTETFTIDLASDSEEMVDIVVYDMTGKLVETMKAEAAQLPTLKLGGNLAAGVYNLIVTQGGTVKTLRVVKNVN